jgi:hypothetical protein
MFNELGIGFNLAAPSCYIFSLHIMWNVKESKIIKMSYSSLCFISDSGSHKSPREYWCCKDYRKSDFAALHRRRTIAPGSQNCCCRGPQVWKIHSLLLPFCESVNICQNFGATFYFEELYV